MTGLEPDLSDPPGHPAEPENKKSQPQSSSGRHKYLSSRRTEKIKQAAKSETNQTKVRPVMKSPNTKQTSENKPQKHSAATRGKFTQPKMSKHKCVAQKSSRLKEHKLDRGVKTPKQVTTCTDNKASQKPTKNNHVLPLSSKRQHQPTERSSPVTLTTTTGLPKSTTTNKKAATSKPGTFRLLERPTNNTSYTRKDQPEGVRTDSSRKKKKRIESSANENASIKKRKNSKLLRKLSDEKEAMRTTWKSKPEQQQQNEKTSSEKTKTEIYWNGTKSTPEDLKSRGEELLFIYLFVLMYLNVK